MHRTFSDLQDFSGAALLYVLVNCADKVKHPTPAGLCRDSARSVPRTQRRPTRLDRLRSRDVRPPTERVLTSAPKKAKPCTVSHLSHNHLPSFRRLDNLISRFEEPQSAARWDAPLFTIATDDPPFDEPAATTQTGGEAVPLGSTEAERIWTAITEGVIKPSTVATQQVSPVPARLSAFIGMQRPDDITL